MVVNCLPLYEPPDEEAWANADSDLRPLSPSHNNSDGRSKLIKARSMESICSSQLGDNEDRDSARTTGEVATPPRRKASKFAHYSVTVHDKPLSSSNATTSQPVANNESEKCEENEQTVDDQSGAKLQTSAEPRNTKDNDEKKTDKHVVSSNDKTAAGDPDVVQVEKEHSTNTEKGNVNSVSESEEGKKEEQEFSSNGMVRDETAAERKPEPENKLEGSGEVVKSKPEANGDDSEQRKHTKLQKTHSERASLSPDGDLSDSEDNGFSVNYIQDPFVVPQLKRSSGSVSFYYSPNLPTVGATETTAISSTHNVRDEALLEMSSENKLESTSLEKSEDTITDKADGATGEGEPANREKSLSTTKSPILLETDSILQQSASSSPTTPAESSLSPVTSSPPSSPDATAQAPPTSSGPLALLAMPLPVSPVTLDKDYTERSGWLNKLSHRKGMFGDKWQKRYFVLHRSWLYYFKKYGVSMQ